MHPFVDVVDIYTWMCQEVSKWLVSGLQPQYTPFISRLKPIDPNHLLTSWDIQVSSLWEKPHHLGNLRAVTGPSGQENFDRIIIDTAPTGGGNMFFFWGVGRSSKAI